MKLQINEFKGILPKLANDKLPNNMAQIAADLKTASGELVAIKKSTADVALTGSSYKTFFEYLEGSNKHWVYYDDVAFWSRSHVADDTFERTYLVGGSAVASVGTITFLDSITDGETVTIGADVYEFDIADDGVAGGNIDTGTAATTTKELAGAAIVAASAAGTAAVTLTDNEDGTVTVTANTAGTAGNTIAFSNTGAKVSTDQYNSTNFLGGTQEGFDSTEYRCFANDIISGGGFDFENDFYQPSAPVDMAAAQITNATPGAVYRAYLYTYVSRYGEESGPSLITENTIYTAGEAMEINAITPSTEDQYINESGSGANIPKMRFYRTATDGTGAADFLLVCEAVWFDQNDTYVAGDHVLYDDGGGLDLYRCTVGGTGTWAGGTHTFVAGELVVDADLGEALPTATWGSIPSAVTNLRSHPNGFFVASKDRELYFCEPFNHHSWPEDYKITLDATIIGIGIFGSTIVVCTDANVYLFTGPHPDSLYKQKLSFQPCLSQRGVVETDTGVIFPAKAGFQLVDSSGIRNITKDFFSPDDWDDYELETIHGHWYNEAYYGFYKSATYEGNIRIDFLNQSITTGADYHYAGYVALVDGKFRTIFSSSITTSALYISQWDNDTTRYRNYQYKSPRFILEKPANFKVAQVVIDTDFYNDVLEIISDDTTLATLNAAEWALGLIDAPLNGAALNEQDVNGDGLYSLSSLGVQDYIEFKIYVNSVLKFTKQISDSNMFKLPRGFKHKKWEIEIIGMLPVKRVTLATSTEEIDDG
jgi:hypothetical protein